MKLNETISGSGYTTDDLRKMAAEKQAFQDANNKQLSNNYMQYNPQHYCPYCNPQRCPCCGKPYSLPQYYPYYYMRGGGIGSANSSGSITCNTHDSSGG